MWFLNQDFQDFKDEMEILAVGCYEDGGLCPYVNVNNEKVTFYE
jgi:hypothetical protein